MAERREQEKPLAPATQPILFNKPQYTPFAAEFTSRRRQRYLKCCGCAAALLLILVFTILILTITVFHVKDPTLKLNSLKIDGLDLLSNNTNLNRGGGLNLTLEADISIKNPNAASFKFEEATTDVYYEGAVVGEVRSPAGEARARRTRTMSVVVDVMVDKMVGVKRFESDLIAGSFAVSTSTRISGVVKIADVVKKSVVVKMKCTMNLDLRSHAIQDRVCGRRVSF